MVSTVPIRAVVGRFSMDWAHDTMEDVISKHPFDFAAIISSGKEPKYYSSIPQEKQEWFVSSDIRSCIYDGVDFNTVCPLDEELIESMREAEVIFMDTVSRLEWKDLISYTERKRMYFCHLRFWSDYLTRKKINLYISAWMPHEIPDLLLYHLCKKRGIPVVYYHASPERDVSHVEYDFHESAVQIQKRFGALRTEYANAQRPEDIPLSPQFEERYRSLTAPQGEKPALQSVKVPTYWDHVSALFIQKPLQFSRHLVAFATPGGFMRAIRALQRYRVIHTRNSFYDAKAVEPDLSQRYVYMALHFQPEMSTVPMGGAFGDQIRMAQMLSAHLPDDVLIYVKEHPRESSWQARDVQYYKDFLEVKNVRLVARHVNSFLLREHCTAVATATGTVGYEALFREKPVFMFGDRFYKYADGIFRIRTNEDCKRAVQAIFMEGYKPSLLASRLYLKAMEDTGVRGLLNPWDRKATKLSDQEHLAAMSTDILHQLDVLKEDIARVG